MNAASIHPDKDLAGAGELKTRDFRTHAVRGSKLQGVVQVLRGT